MNNVRYRLFYIVILYAFFAFCRNTEDYRHLKGKLSQSTKAFLLSQRVRTDMTKIQTHARTHTHEKSGQYCSNKICYGNFNKKANQLLDIARTYLFVVVQSI
jgi:hypothetical protein